MDDVQIRLADLDDLPAITDIYNEAILTTTATFDTHLKTLAEQKGWFDRHGGKYPILVAQVSGEVLGWVAISPWSDRGAYANTAEISVYVADKARGRGVGKKLYANAIEMAKEVGLHTLIARIADSNPQSITLHESLGFEKIGVMRKVGRKFGKTLDVHLYQIVFPVDEWNP